MNVLLVDDDRFVIAALEKKIDWNALSITDVYTACNVTQAQTIMTQNEINICVCDIEMPGKSGLDLLSWVRENNMDTLFIFLTSYADFSYAQKAISLSSMDYLLKPIDFSKLSQILEKAVAKSARRGCLEQNAGRECTLGYKLPGCHRFILERFVSKSSYEGNPCLRTQTFPKSTALYAYRFISSYLVSDLS